MKRLLLIILVLYSLNACEQPYQQVDLVGAWKVDSTYSFYNGFGHTQRVEGPDWATSVYEEDGVMNEIKYGSFQSFFYNLEAEDTLTLRSTHGGEEVSYKILHLSNKQMVLKKHKQPIFDGKNQERYEIRFFSKTEPPAESALPFSDPRK